MYYNRGYYNTGYYNGSPEAARTPTAPGKRRRGRKQGEGSKDVRQFKEAIDSVLYPTAMQQSREEAPLQVPATEQSDRLALLLLLH